MQPPAGRPPGFTLVEFMIAITIGLVLLVALLTLSYKTNRSNREMANMNSQIDNGRFAIQFLENDIAHAGFWGTYLPQFADLAVLASIYHNDAPNAVPDPCLTYNATNWNIAYRNLIGIPVQPDYMITEDDPTEAVTVCTDVVSHQQPNTDVLIVRHAESCVHGVGNCELLLSPGKLYFQASLCELENTTPYVFNTYATGTVATDFPLHKGNCVGTGTPPHLPITAGDAAELRRFISNIYYIRDYAVTEGDDIPTLVRSEFDLRDGTLAHQPAVPLIEGIEGLRVEFGIDSRSKTDETVDYNAAIDWQDEPDEPPLTTPKNRGDGMPDGPFVHCTSATPCTAAQLTNVTAAKLYVLARAREATPGYQDTKTYRLGTATTETICARDSTDSACTLKTLDPSYKRHLFSTTVRLTNVSARRETP